MKIDIISGFLGAGKTTFIKRLLNTKLKNEKVVLIENEFGEVSVDTAFLADSKIDIKELSQGCICCSLFGDFTKSLNEIVTTYHPDRILIEPSGVGKLSDIMNAVADAGLKDHLNSLVCMVDANKAKMYAKNFGEFFLDQIHMAHTIILSRTDIASSDKVQEALEIIRSQNQEAVIVTTPVKELSDEELFKAYEGIHDHLMAELMESLEHHEEDECCCGHHHHHDEEECECGHHHHHDEEECECEHHHHHDEEECGCEHHHHHDEEECECEHHHHHDEEACGCGHHHHHHHDADEVFSSVGIETAKKYDKNALSNLLKNMSNGVYGMVVRAKGVVCGTDGKWIQFNLTPGEVELVEGSACAVGKICVIGSKIDEEQIKKLF